MAQDIHFGGFVRAKRISLGLSLAELAEKAGITEKRLWQIEHMKGPKSTGKTLRGLANALGYSLDELVVGYKNNPVEVPENGGGKMRITPPLLKRLVDAATRAGVDLETYIIDSTDEKDSTGKIVTVRKSKGSHDAAPPRPKRQRGRKRGPAADGKEQGLSK